MGRVLTVAGQSPGRSLRRQCQTAPAKTVPLCCVEAFCFCLVRQSAALPADPLRQTVPLTQCNLARKQGLAAVHSSLLSTARRTSDLIHPKHCLIGQKRRRSGNHDLCPIAPANFPRKKLREIVWFFNPRTTGTELPPRTISDKRCGQPAER